MHVIKAATILTWTAAIAYVPLSLIYDLQLAPLQRCIVAAAGVLSLIWWHRHGGEYKMGYGDGWRDRERARRERRG